MSDDRYGRDGFGDALCHRHDDGTVTVSRADDRIGVAVELLEGAHPWVFPNGDWDTIQLDTAGEYRYRQVGPSPVHPGVLVFDRIRSG